GFSCGYRALTLAGTIGSYPGLFLRAGEWQVRDTTSRGGIMTHARGLRLTALIALGALAGADPADAQLAAEMKLEDAGFIMRRADTPEKMAQLRKLPPHRFATRVGKTGRYYIWADPEKCQCAFVGTERAFQAYRDMQRAGLPQPDNVPA